jgi:hypothetical protein
MAICIFCTKLSCRGRILCEGEPMEGVDILSDAPCRGFDEVTNPTEKRKAQAFYKMLSGRAPRPDKKKGE